MTIYGLYGFMHGGARALTVMSEAGATAATAAIEPGTDITVVAEDGHLTRYLEKRGGALRRLVERHGIVILTKPDWDAKKAALGEAIYR
jgi:hypothetical protein